jgi:dihydrofolate synthase/folylpolyglutamate synthase
VTVHPAPATLEGAERFHATVTALERLRHRGIRPGVARMAELCATLGHPERAAPAVHLTGTNGKGSTAKMISALLRARGHRVGLYTSPHLVDVTERIALDDVPISHQRFVDLFESLAPTFEAVGTRLGEPITHFEALTAMALVAFAQEQADALVIEVGIGGTHDDTNVVDAKVAVVTNVDLDHARYLGNTREEVAAQKAGIIKASAVAVLGDIDPAIVGILEARCAEVGATPWRLGQEFQVLHQAPAPGGRLVAVATPHGCYEVRIPLRGAHQAANAACALAASEAFLGGPLPPSSLAALETMANPAHLELFGDGPAAAVDVAHNPHGAAALAAALEEAFGPRPQVLVFGVSPDKDAAEMLRRLGRNVSGAVFTRCPDAPHREPEDLAELAQSLGYHRVLVEADPMQAVHTARSLAHDEELIVLTGSHYWIGAVYLHLVEVFGPPSPV